MPLFPIAGAPLLQHHVEACTKVQCPSIIYSHRTYSTSINPCALMQSKVISSPCSLIPTLSHPPTLKHPQQPQPLTLPHSHTPTLTHPAAPASHTPTLPHSHTPSSPSLSHSHTHTPPAAPASHTPTLHIPSFQSLHTKK